MPASVDPLLELRAAATTRAAPAAGFVLGKVAGGGIGVEFIDRTIAGDVVLRTAPTEPNATIRLDRPTVDLRRPPAGGEVVVERPPIVRPPIVRPPIDLTAVFEGPTVTVPPLVRDAPVLTRFEAAIAQLADVGALADAPPARQLVPYALAAAAQSLTTRCHPSNAHVARVGSMVSFGDVSMADLRAGAARDGVTVAPTFDRIMAYPELAVPGATAARPLRPHASAARRRCHPARFRHRCSRRTPASSPPSLPASTTSSTASCCGVATPPTSGARRCAGSGIGWPGPAPPMSRRCTSGPPIARSSTSPAAGPTSSC